MRVVDVAGGLFTRPCFTAGITLTVLAQVIVVFMLLGGRAGLQRHMRQGAPHRSRFTSICVDRPGCSGTCGGLSYFHRFPFQLNLTV